MQAISLRILLFLIITIISQGMPPTSKNSLMIEYFTQPYREIAFGLQNSMREQANTFKEMINTVATGKTPILTSEKLGSPKIKPKAPKRKQIDISHPLFKDVVKETNTTRMLQNSCNTGISVQTTQTEYLCNNQIVSQAIYDDSQIIGVTSCTTKTMPITLCYCPMDWYGANCEYWGSPVCNIKELDNLGNCSGTNSWAYAFNIEGVPPCTTVNVGDVLNFKQRKLIVTKHDSFEINCENAPWNYPYEGIKVNLENSEHLPIYYAPVTVNHEFPYAVNYSNLKLTYNNPLPVNFEFINFGGWYFYDTIQYSTSISGPQLIGLQPASISVSVTSNLESYSTVGRYYYQIVVDGGNNNKAYVGALEVNGYSEPPYQTYFNPMILIIVLVLLYKIHMNLNRNRLVAVATFVWYRRYKKEKLEDKKFKEMAENQIFNEAVIY